MNKSCRLFVPTIELVYIFLRMLNYNIIGTYTRSIYIYEQYMLHILHLGLIKKKGTVTTSTCYWLACHDPRVHVTTTLCTTTVTLQQELFGFACPGTASCCGRIHRATCKAHHPARSRKHATALGCVTCCHEQRLVYNRLVPPSWLVRR